MKLTFYILVKHCLNYMDLNEFFKNNYFNTRKKKNLAQKKKKKV